MLCGARIAQLAGLLDPVTLQALGTNPDPLNSAVHIDADGLQVGVPAPLGSVIGVADIVTGNRAFCANGAYPCHKLHLIHCSETRKASKPSEPGRMIQPHLRVYHA